MKRSTGRDHRTTPIRCTRDVAGVLSTVLLIISVAAPVTGCAAGPAADAHTDLEAARRALNAYFEAFRAQDRTRLRGLITDDFELIENGYPIRFERFTETWDTAEPWTWRYSLENVDIEVSDDIALFQYGLRWRDGDTTTFSGIETGVARRVHGQWLLARFHGTWLARRVDVPDLSNYVGMYGNSRDGYTIVADSAALYAERVDRRPLSIGVRRAELIPVGPNRFVQEFDETAITFERDSSGRVDALVLVNDAATKTRLAKSAQ